jgi:hypothetical protein
MTEQEFNSLLTAYLDGDIRDEDLIALEQAIRNNPALKKQFQTEVRLHALIHEAALTQQELKGFGTGKILSWTPQRPLSVYVTVAASAACLGLAVLLGMLLQDQRRDAPVIGRFLQVSGHIQSVTDTDRTNLFTKDDQIVKEGDRITCDPGMQSLIELNDGTLLSLEGGSILTIDRNQADNIEISVEQGKVLFEVAEQDPTLHHVIVKTPQTVATVLGTLFSVEVQDSWSRAEVYEGLVRVRQEETGDERDVGKGQRVETWADGFFQVDALTHQRTVIGSPQFILSPTDDVYIQNRQVVNKRTLYVEGQRRLTYLKFDVPLIDTIRTARLHLTQLGDVGRGTLRFYAAAHNNWSEQDLNAEQFPGTVQEIARYSGVVGLGQTVALDVSKMMTQTGLFTLIVSLDTTGSNDIAFGSKESAQGPRLVLNEHYSHLGSGIPSTRAHPAPAGLSDSTILAPTADVTIEDGQPRNDHHLYIEKQRRISYLRFEVPGKRTVHKARLLLRQTFDTGSGTIRFFEGSDSNWTEQSITIQTTPQPVREIASCTGIVGSEDTIDIDVSSLVTGPGAYTLIIKLDEGGDDDIAFGSRESAVDPKLIVTWEPKEQ